MTTMSKQKLTQENNALIEKIRSLKSRNPELNITYISVTRDMQVGECKEFEVIDITEKVTYFGKRYLAILKGQDNKEYALSLSDYKMSKLLNILEEGNTKIKVCKLADRNIRIEGA